MIDLEGSHEEMGCPSNLTDTSILVHYHVRPPYPVEEAEKCCQCIKWCANWLMSSICVYFKRIQIRWTLRDDME